MKLKNKKPQLKNISGMSLLEILVAITLFAILGVIVSRSILLTLRGSKKSEATLKAKENINYAVSVIERQIRNADSVTCPNPDVNTLNFTDTDGNSASFSCVGMGTDDSYIASGSARITSSDVSLIECSFVCSQDVSTVNPSITIYVAAEEKSATGIENTTVTTSTQIFLRNY